MFEQDIMSSPIHPPALSRGDSVAVVAPSMTVPDQILERGLSRLENVFDLNPVVYDLVRADNDYLREHPEERAADLMRAFESEEISGIVSVGGGDDQIRVLKFLDPDRIQDNPTRFFGYSDNNNLSLYLWNYGIVSYGGGQILPSLSTDPEIHSYTKEYLERAFFQERVGEIHPADEWTQKLYDFDGGGSRKWREHPGWSWERNKSPVEGRVWGGCLEIISFQLMTGTYLPQPSALDGSILALETSEEVPSLTRVRRILMCMGERGILEQFSGVVVGRPKSASPDGPEKDHEEYRRSQREVICQQINRYNPEIPIVMGLDFGHTDPHFPLPIGCCLRLEPENERIVCT